MATRVRGLPGKGDLPSSNATLREYDRTCSAILIAQQLSPALVRTGHLFPNIANRLLPGRPTNPCRVVLPTPTGSSYGAFPAFGSPTNVGGSNASPGAPTLAAFITVR